MGEAAAGKSHTVFLMNQKITIRSEAGDACVQRAADFVNDKIREITERSKNIPALTLSLLTCINIAGEYLKYKEGHEALNLEAQRKVGDLISLIVNEESSRMAL